MRDQKPLNEPFDPPRLVVAGRPEQSKMPTHLDALADRARDYADRASSANTRRAYDSDWRHYLAWCRRQSLPSIPVTPESVGLYITALATGAASNGAKPSAVATIKRKLSALTWHAAQRGDPVDRSDRHIATVLAGITRTHGRPPLRKEAVLPEDLRAMLATLEPGTLAGLRDRAILLVGFAGGLRRSEIVGLDCGRDDTQDGAGWVEFLDAGLLVTLRGKTGWREVEIGRGANELTCPVAALSSWLRFARIDHGALFRRVFKGGKAIAVDRLGDRHVARLVKQAALKAGIRSDLSERAHGHLFAGHSLRAGLASSADIDERYVQKQLGHASAEMTRRYQRRRDRFRVNLTTAAGL